MKKFFLLLAIAFLALSANAQKFLTREGFIKFYGSTPMEDIEAVTKQASSVIDAESKAVVFQVLLNSFAFEKALMQEHFNENYVESEKFPKATFKGTIVGDVDLSKSGTFEVSLNGNMNLHGVDKELTVPATIIVEKEGMKLSSEFSLVPEDFRIEIPGAVREKIAKQMEVTVKCAYKPVKK